MIAMLVSAKRSQRVDLSHIFPLRLKNRISPPKSKRSITCFSVHVTAIFRSLRCRSSFATVHKKFARFHRFFFSSIYLCFYVFCAGYSSSIYSGNEATRRLIFSSAFCVRVCVWGGEWSGVLQSPRGRGCFGSRNAAGARNESILCSALS